MKSQDEAMLDVSMIADRSSLKRLMAVAAQDPRALGGLRVSATFVERLALRSKENDTEMVRQLNRYFAVERRLIDMKLIRKFVESVPFREYVRAYRAENGHRTQGFRRNLLQDMGEKDARAYEIVVEEWEFLMTHSWLFAKTRAIYDRLVDAGADAIYMTKKKLEKTVEAVKGGIADARDSTVLGCDRVVNRTLKKGEEHKVSPNDRIRAVSKWVAVGGGAATTLINPIVGVLGATAGGMFILYDPQRRLATYLASFRGWYSGRAGQPCTYRDRPPVIPRESITGILLYVPEICRDSCH
jgi:hypothetical protein